jgi:CRP-like cAMP-binding protein
MGFGRHDKHDDAGGGSASGGDRRAAPQWLATVPLLEGLSDPELRRVAELGRRIEVDAGDVLVDQGDPGTHCYVVAEGTASVYVNGEHVNTTGPGTTIGEMALIDHRPRTATVVADGPMVLLRFDIRAFAALLEEMPKANERIMGILGARLRRGM